MASRKLPKPDTERKSPVGPVTTHRYTNVFPLIFPTLHHADTHVVRANPTLDADGEPVPEVGIVVLHEGDEITLPDGYTHAWLEPLNPPTTPDEEQQS